MTTLRDTLLSFGRPAHEFRVVRHYTDEEDDWVVFAEVDARFAVVTDTAVVLSSIPQTQVTDDHLREVDALNDFITANRRLVGLEVDEFARNGIE